MSTSGKRTVSNWDYGVPVEGENKSEISTEISAVTGEPPQNSEDTVPTPDLTMPNIVTALFGGSTEGGSTKPEREIERFVDGFPASAPDAENEPKERGGSSSSIAAITSNNTSAESSQPTDTAEGEGGYIERDVTGGSHWKAAARRLLPARSGLTLTRPPDLTPERPKLDGQQIAKSSTKGGESDLSEVELEQEQKQPLEHSE